MGWHPIQGVFPPPLRYSVVLLACAVVMALHVSTKSEVYAAYVHVACKAVMIRTRGYLISPHRNYQH